MPCVTNYLISSPRARPARPARKERGQQRPGLPLEGPQDVELHERGLAQIDTKVQKYS